MHFVKRKGSTACKADEVENYEELKTVLMERIKEGVSEHEIHASTILNWDHAGLNLVPGLSGGCGKRVLREWRSLV